MACPKRDVVLRLIVKTGTRKSGSPVMLSYVLLMLCIVMVSENWKGNGSAAYGFTTSMLRSLSINQPEMEARGWG